MFYGHYCGAWFVKVIEPRIPIWVLMNAVQFIDILHNLFVIFHTEKIKIRHDFTICEEIISVPYSHSLLGATIWCLVAGLWYRFFSGLGGGNKATFLICLLVLSHWFEDLVVHEKDLLLFTFDNTKPKYGFGLYKSFLLSQLLETGLILSSFIYYLKNTKTSLKNSANFWTKWGVSVVFVDFVISHSTSYITPPNVLFLCFTALTLHFKSCYLANQLDKVRIPTSYTLTKESLD
ncbi:14622_t:CDS:2 [Gigaspora margarita]|uniref:14622_t:CDS:1 n=1 Tax=Gigaspora margarita TaxID=4874 RepID=A0ABN7UEY0_GIGMA|nr:14622_t:CDS:2 [Gigaspora margarita]